MKLIALIQHLKTLEAAEAFAEQMLGDSEFDNIEVYMKETLDIDADLILIDRNNFEKPDDVFEITYRGTVYIKFLPLNLLQDMSEAGSKQSNDLDLAQRIVHYAVHDA